MIDADDIEQAIEISLGDTLGNGISNPRAVTEQDISRLKARFRRVLEELPGEVTVFELLEAME